MTQRIEISYKTIIFTVFFLIALYFLFLIKDIIFLVLFSFILASGLRPAVEKLESLKIPRPIGILIIYLILIFSIVLVISFLVPPLGAETFKLTKELTNVIYSFSPYIDVSPQQITDKITPLTGDIFRVTLGVFTNLFSIFTLFVFTFYLLLERRHMRVFLKNILGESNKEKVVDVILEMETRLGAWIRGQLALAFIIGTMSYIGLKILQVEPVLPLAIFAGMLEVVPIIGPIISAIPAVIVAFVISPWLALSVVALYFLIQQLENNLIVPLVMRRAVGIPPIVSLLALLIGGKLAGIVGIILSVPVFVCLQVFVQRFVLEKETFSPMNQKASSSSK